VGTQAFRRALDVPWSSLPPGAVILEVGVERDTPLGEVGSTTFLAGVGPPLHAVDVDPAQYARAAALPNTTAHLGRAEDVLPRVLAGVPRDPATPTSPPLVLGFLWLDGHDWPYAHAPDSTWDAQRAEYHARHQDYSRAASQLSHLVVAQLAEPFLPVGALVACDDTWELPSPLDDTPAPPPALDGTPTRGFNGKCGSAAPYLLDRGFTVVESGDIHHGFVLLRRDSRPG